MSEENKTLIKRWFEEVWNQGNTAAIDEMFSADGVAHGLTDETGNPMRGPDEYKIFHAAFRGAFPNIVVTVEDTIAEGDKLAARCVVRGHHDGDTLGLAATHVPMEITGITIVRIQDGKIVEAWNNFDFMKLYRQIGAI